MKKEIKTIIKLKELKEELTKKLGYPIDLKEFLYKELKCSDWCDRYIDISLAQFEEISFVLNEYTEDEIKEYYSCPADFLYEKKVFAHLIEIFKNEGIENEILVEC